MNGLHPYPATTSPDLRQVHPGEHHIHRNAQWSGVILLTGLSQTQIQGLKKLAEVATLPQNWDSYGSPPPTQVSVEVAKILIKAIDCENLPPLRIVPVPGGGLQLEWNVGTRELELEILHDGSVEYLKSDRGEPLEEGRLVPINLDEVQTLLTWLSA